MICEGVQPQTTPHLRPGEVSHILLTQETQPCVGIRILQTDMNKAVFFYVVCLILRIRPRRRTTRNRTPGRRILFPINAPNETFTPLKRFGNLNISRLLGCS